MRYCDGGLRLATRDRAVAAGVRPPSSSLKVFSSTSNPVLPSQLDPSGKRVFAPAGIAPAPHRARHGCR